MSQIALPLALPGGDEVIVGGLSLQAVFAALQASTTWPYRTAVLSGPPRSGKSLFARWFAASGAGVAIDDADLLDQTDLFHHWNRAQADGQALLLIAGNPAANGGWQVALPDLASRLGAARPMMPCCAGCWPNMRGGAGWPWPKWCSTGWCRASNAAMPRPRRWWRRSTGCRSNAKRR